MTKDVLVSIQGLQFEGDMDSEKIETITRGEYYKKNDGHYIIFEEATEGFEEMTKSIIHIKDHELNITKRGLVNVHMVFEENKKNMTSYATPYGDIIIGINAKSVNLTETDDNMVIDVDYALEVNYEHFADCKIKMDIRPKESGGMIFRDLES